MRKFVNGKVDEGFELNYRNLSYRRKFIRTMWFVPPAVLLMVFAIPEVKSPVMFLMLFCATPVVALLQALYTWFMWNKHERPKTPPNPNSDC